MPRENRAPLTSRVSMFISPEEREAIEDYRYLNRIPTFSEAFRRLAAIGLEAAPTPLVTPVRLKGKACHRAAERQRPNAGAMAAMERDGGYTLHPDSPHGHPVPVTAHSHHSAIPGDYLCESKNDQA